MQTSKSLAGGQTGRYKMKHGAKKTSKKTGRNMRYGDRQTRRKADKKSNRVERQNIYDLNLFNLGIN